MTKNEILGKLNLAINLEMEMRSILTQIHTDLYEEDLSCDKFLHATAQVVEESDNTIYALSMLKNRVGISQELENLKEGSENPIPQLTIDKKYPSHVEFSFPTDNGKLTAYTSLSDDNTLQVGTLIYAKDGSPIDLSLSEIKKGTLAEAYHLPDNNKDVDVYVWGNPHSEDYSTMYRIEDEDIQKALAESPDKCENEESERDY